MTLRRIFAVVVAFASAAHAQPAPTLPPYQHPATIADGAGIPSGAPTIRGEDVCYGRDAHRRLAYMLAAVEPLSDARATQAWAWGYRDGRLEPVAELEAERARRVAAEAEAERAKSGGFGAYLATGAVGVAVGVLAALLIGGAL